MFLLSLLLAAAPPEAEEAACHVPMPASYDPGPDVAPCDDHAALAAKALLGQLWAAEERCLDARVEEDPDPTARHAASRLLIQNAESRGHKAEWERVTKRHLEELDASDAELVFRYALHMSRAGSKRAEETIRWADVVLALEAQRTGDPDVRTRRAHALRARATNRLWQEAEMAHSEGRGSEADATRARARAVEAARRWGEVSPAGEQDAKEARALCRHAGGCGTE